MDRVSLSGQYVSGFLHCIYSVEFDAQGTLGQFSVVIDTDILDAYLICRQQRGDGGDRTWLVCNIYRQHIFRFDRAA